MSAGALVAAWFVGLLCGAAMMESKSYRIALAGYFLCVGLLQWLGVTGAPWALDLLLLAGFILICFGVARGIIAQLWEGKDHAGK